MIVPAVRFQARGQQHAGVCTSVGANLDFPKRRANVAFNFAVRICPRGDERRFFDVAQLRSAGFAGHVVWAERIVEHRDDAGQARIQFQWPDIAEVETIRPPHHRYPASRLSEKAALRLAVYYAYNDGFEVPCRTRRTTSVRLSTILKPVEAFRSIFTHRARRSASY